MGMELRNTVPNPVKIEDRMRGAFQVCHSWILQKGNQLHCIFFGRTHDCIWEHMQVGAYGCYIFYVLFSL